MLARRLVEVEIRRRWPSTVGADVARRARPGPLVGDCLHVTVDNSPWCQELTWRAPTLVAALTAQLGPGVVGSLRVTVGTLSPAPETAPAEPPAPARQPSEDEQRAIGALLAPIADGSLASALRRLLIKTGRFASK